MPEGHSLCVALKCLMTAAVKSFITIYEKADAPAMHV
jgi:hypothetical protein